MMRVYKYSFFRKWATVIMALCVAIIPYGFFRHAFPIEHYLFSSICLFVAMGFLFALLNLFNSMSLRIIENQKGLNIKKIFGSYSIQWDEISEYGRERRLVFCGYVWAYYFKKNQFGDKKFLLCDERLIAFESLHDSIIENTKNTSPVCLF